MKNLTELLRSDLKRKRCGPKKSGCPSTTYWCEPLQRFLCVVCDHELFDLCLDCDHLAGWCKCGGSA